MRNMQMGYLKVQVDEKHVDGYLKVQVDEKHVDGLSKGTGR